MIDLPFLFHEGLFKNDPLQKAKASTIGQFERPYLGHLLIHFRGDISQAAKAAGKERRSFQRLLKRYGFEREAFETV